MITPSHLLCLPSELLSEIVSHVAVPCSPLSPRFHSPSTSHWDAYSFYKLVPASCRDLQSLSLTHTHLLPFSRARLFQCLRVYPGMSPARVTALVDLFSRSPELLQYVKVLWWTMGVEEYKADADHQWFKYASEEREVRKAKVRLELVEALTRNAVDMGCGGLRRVLITGCESQRRFDDAQRKRSPNGLPPSFSPFVASGLVDDDQCRVMKALAGVLASPSLSSISMANIAFPGELFGGCSRLEEMRLGDDVNIIETGNYGATPAVKRPPRLRVLALPRSSLPSIASAGSTVNSLFDKGWLEGRTDGDESLSYPTLDLSALESISCQFPSPAFSSAARNIGPDHELREISLQVNNIEALVEGVVDGTLGLIADDKPLDQLRLAYDLPSSITNVVTSDQNNGQSTEPILPSPPSLSDQVLGLVTLLVAHPKTLARAVDLRLSGSVDQGLEILSGPRALGLLPLARKMGSRFPDHAGASRGRQSVNIHFFLRPGCSSGYGGYSGLIRGDEGSGSGGIQAMKDQIAELHAEAIGILRGVGVKLEVGYSLVA